MWRESDSIDRTGLVAAVEQSADGIVITDTEGTIQYVNAAFTAMTGYTSEEAVWQPARILNSGCQPAAFYENLWNTIGGGQVWQGELINRRKDGTLYEEEMRIAPVAHADGEASGYIAIKRDVTGRRAAADAQRLLRAVVESAGDAIFACTPEGVILTWNRGAEEVFGYAAGETVGKNVSMLVAPERLSLLRPRIEKVLQGESALHYEGLGMRRDGRRVPVGVSACPIRDAEGRVVAISAIMRDISERQEAERARAQLASIVESSCDAIHSTALDGTIVSWNRGAEQLMGYSSQEIIGRNAAILAIPGRAGRVAEHLGVIRTGRALSPFETVAQGKDGCPIDVSLSISPIRNPAGEVVGASTIVRDIRERLRSERMLRESEERFEDVFEQAPFGIYVAAPDGRIVQANAALCRMLGYSREELTARTWLELTHPDDRETAIGRVQNMRWEPGQSSEAEKRCLRRNGEVVWVRVKVSLIRHAGDTRLYSVVHVEDITQRRVAAEKLLESEKRFQDVFEQAPVGICVAGVDGRILQTNTAFCRMLGYSRQELTGKSWMELTHPDDLEPALRKRERLWTGPDGAMEDEMRHLHRSGSVVHVRVRVSLVRDSGGRPETLVVHIEDITGRKRTEEALRASEERRRMLAQAVESAGECVSITDTGNRILYANQAFLRTYGYEEDELIGRPVDMVRSRRTSPDVQEAILPATLAGGWHGELWNRAKDGREFPVALVTSEVYDERGARVALVGIARDITERKRAEQALRSSEERFRQLAENMHEVVWMMPLTGGEPPYVNAEYERVWGRSCESIRCNPMSWLEAVHPDDLEAARLRFAAELTGELGQAEYRIRTPGGQEKWIWDRAFPIRDEAGQLIRIVGIAEDITARKRHEAELIQAREAADAASLAKSRFLANMSHEIRTPMNGVLGMLQLLLESDLTTEQRRYLDLAQTSGWALLALIDDILDISKIEAGKLSLEKLSFNPRRTVEEVAQTMRAQAHSKGLDFRWRVSPEVPALLCGDAHRLRQVLMNLCGNAVKFTERGNASLDVTLENRGEHAVTLRFEIADTGIGIRPEQAKALFAPFVQADASTTRKYGGTGLGLAICKQLVGMMGGAIGATSAGEGLGSTFWFTVVLSEAPEPVPVRQPEATGWGGSVADSPRVAGARREGRILVAEDNLTNREVALAQLRKLGYQATAVPDGAAAVEAVGGGGYDLVLMDCDMPVMDGFEATRRIRQSDRPATPIVALTADAMPADCERCLDGGMDDYLAKPVDLERLAEVLTRWLPPSGQGPGEPAADCFDEKALLWRLMGDRRLAGIVLKGFLEDVPAHLYHFRRKLSEGDCAGAQSLAHALKGAAATVGAEDLHEAALAMEQAGAEGRLDRCRELLPRAAGDFERFKRALERAGWASC